MSPEDFGGVQRLLVGLAARLKTGLDFFYGLSFGEVLDIMREVAELGKRQRVLNGHKVRR